MPMTIIDGKATKAIGGRQANIAVEVACNPQDLYVDPSIP
jgi:hypothetical protein